MSLRSASFEFDLLPERSVDEKSEVSLRLPIDDVDEISGCDDKVAEALVGRVVAVADNADAVTRPVPVRRPGQVEVDPPLRLLAERLRPRRELPFVGGENPVREPQFVDQDEVFLDMSGPVFGGISRVEHRIEAPAVILIRMRQDEDVDMRDLAVELLAELQ